MKSDLLELAKELTSLSNKEKEEFNKILEALSESQSVSDNEDKRKNCRGYDKECNERFKDGFNCKCCFYY